MPVGLVVMPQPERPVPLHDAAGRALLERYCDRVRSVAAAGARVVVLPEKAFLVTDDTMGTLVDAFAPVARGLCLRGGGHGQDGGEYGGEYIFLQHETLLYA